MIIRETDDDGYVHLFLEDAPKQQENGDDSENIIGDDIDCETDFENEGEILYDKNDPEVVAFLLSKKFPDRTFDQLPNPIDTYRDTIFNPWTLKYEECDVHVYPPEPSPFENLKPAYAYGNKI